MNKIEPDTALSRLICQKGGRSGRGKTREAKEACKGSKGRKRQKEFLKWREKDERENLILKGEGEEVKTEADTESDTAGEGDLTNNTER